MRAPLPVVIANSAGTEQTSFAVTTSPGGVACVKGYTASINASATLAASIGEALAADVSAITIVNNSLNVLYIQFTGSAATSSSFGLAAGSSIMFYGDKTALDLVRIYTGSASSISFITHS